jgi:hypothetical protein
VSMNVLNVRFARNSSLLLVGFLGIGLLLNGVLCFAAGDEASLKIGEARDAIGLAFEAVLVAEGAGANVSGLTARLDEAGRVLGDAETAYGEGNVSVAFDKAVQSAELVEGVKNDAVGLKSSALAGAQRVFRLGLAFGVAGVPVFAVSLLVVWWWFKRFYVRKLLRMKPEVASDAEA